MCGIGFMVAYGKRWNIVRQMSAHMRVFFQRIVFGFVAVAFFQAVSMSSACVQLSLDTDGDGIPDYLDIDADNASIPNDLESPECFYTATGDHAIARITSSLTSPDDNQGDGNIQMLHDGINTLLFNFDASQNYVGATLSRSNPHPNLV
jgi:hypothetical protein